MLSRLLGPAIDLLRGLRQSWLRPRKALRPADPTPAPSLAPLERVRLTDGVGRTLFEQYRSHRSAARGEHETGWLLLGLRDRSEAVALATLPAGANCDAGVAHVRFNSTAQAVGGRIVRQGDKRLTILGVVHTHPGSLRHPSDGDLRGDRDWVQHLRGREGVFAIGTADAASHAGTSPATALFASRPLPHVHCLGKLRFSWYALRQGESSYRSLPVELTIGPDLARDLHAVWAVLEAHADRIDRLMEQQANMRVEVAAEQSSPALVLIVPLAGNDGSLRVLLGTGEVRYMLERKGELLETGHHEDLVDRGVYLLLAQLASGV